MAKKKLCKWKKNRIADKRALLEHITGRPRYLCGKCARVASDRAYLCKPKVLRDPANDAAARSGRHAPQ